MLNHEQIERFDIDGFLVLNEFISAVDCLLLRRQAAELVDSFRPGPELSIFTTNEQTRHTNEYFLKSANQIRFFFEEHAFDSSGNLIAANQAAINKIGHALHDNDAVFAEFSRSSMIREVVTDLGMNNPLLVQSMYIFKQPGIGGEVSCHQDSTFLYTEPNSVIGLWFALEDANVENGCLWAIPGGHRLGLAERFVRTGNETAFRKLNKINWPTEQLVPLEVSAGDLIILNGLLPHLSKRNLSEKSRHAYSLHLIDGDCEYPSENWLQRDPENPFRGF